MKTIAFKIILVLAFFAGSNYVFYDTVTGITLSKSQADLEMNPVEESISYYEKGISYNKSGAYLSAEKEFLRAIDLAIQSQDEEILSYSFHFLGNIEGWKSKFSQSIIYHKKARALFQKLYNSEYEAISNNQIAFAFEALGEYDSTLVYSQINIQNRELIDANQAVLNSYRRIAATYAKLYNYKLAYRYLQKGIEYAEETGNNFLLGEIYLTAGNLFLNNHVNKDIALEYLLEAQELFEDSKDDTEYLYWVKINIGDVYLKTGNDSLALKHYKEVSEELHSSNYAAISIVDHKIGMVYKGREEYDSALLYLQKSIDGMCLICPEIKIHQTLIEAARTSLIIGDSEQAFMYLNRARNIASSSKSSLEMVISYEEIGIYHQTIHQIDSSIYFLELAYHMAEDVGLPKRIKNTAELLSEKYYLKGNYKTASNYLKIANQMNDSLASIEKYTEVAKLEMRFDIEKKEAEITKQKLLRNSFIGSAFLLIIIGLILWKANRNKNRDNRLLAEQKGEIQEISNKLQESTKRKLDFFTNISHEIRTPLTLIKSPLERILKSETNEEDVGNQLQLAINNTNKLKTLVNQILDLQKLDEDLLSLDLSEFEIISFCKEIASSFQDYTSQNNCKLIFEANIAKALIRFDRGRLQSIITNLLSNAFKFNKENGEVLFNLHLNMQQLDLEISDTGKGMNSDHLKKLGERYFQAEDSNTSVEGTGIGLAYVKDIVALAKGKFSVRSELGKGTHISITLPFDTIEVQDDTPVKLEIINRVQVINQFENLISEPSENPQILIVEDNYDLRLFLQELFAPTYQVICAKDGEEGKDLALKHLPDLIISDVMMPKIRGNELCKMLKNDVNTSHITIILFTAKGGADSIIDGYDCGADDYIVKPFDTDVLLRKVKNIISTGENARKKFNFTDIEHSKSIYSDFDKKFLEDCMTIIKMNLDNTHFTVEIFAENLSMHRRTLLRKFNALTGKSPTDLIKHTRMTQAAKLLKEKYRVNEVALMVGYENTNRFSQAFKQFHGVSPSVYK